MSYNRHFNQALQTLLLNNLGIVSASRKALAVNPFRWGACLAVTLGGQLIASPLATVVAQSADAVYWPRAEFVIPFQVDNNGRLPEEVHLEVSLDSGQSWSQCSRGDSRTRQFTYKTSQDGEYLFRLKTVDNTGKLYNNPGAPLRIIVDTSKPAASLAIDMNPRGEMLAQFLVKDNALNQSSITLEFQTDVNPQWQNIPFELSSSTTPGELIGNGIWSIPATTNQLVVRLVAKDLAGNVTEVTRLPQLPRTANMNGGLTFASKLLGNQPLFDAPPGITNNSYNSSTRTSAGTVNDGIGGGNSISAPGPKASIQLGPNPNLNRPTTRTMSEQEIEELRNKSGITVPSTSSSLPTSTPNSQSLTAPLNLGSSDGDFDSFNARPTASNMVSTNTSDNTLSSPLGSSNHWSSSAPSLPGLNNPSSLGGPGTTSAVNPTPNGHLITQNGPNAPTLADQSFAPNQGSSSTALPKLGSPIAADKPKIDALHSNTRAFSLDYKIENDPGAPITEVELWGTVDEGRTWEVWGQDPDRKSPFDIEVENDGLFGFRMVIVGANGLASNRPRSGDEADAWIYVDTAKPIARINSALYGKGQEAGALIIEYTVSDDFLPDRPISLFFSSNPQGPWETISRGVRNQGRFVWPTTPNLPPKIYLRIEALDLAGNVASSTLDLPIDIEGIAPRGRIQGFRPLQPNPSAQ